PHFSTKLADRTRADRNSAFLHARCLPGTAVGPRLGVAAYVHECDRGTRREEARLQADSLSVDGAIGIGHHLHRTARAVDIRAGIDVRPLLARVIHHHDLRAQCHTARLAAPGFAAYVGNEVRLDRDVVAQAAARGNRRVADRRLDVAAQGED